MMKRKADTGNRRRCSRRLQEKEEKGEEKKKMVEEVKITKVSDGVTANNFHALYLNKKSIAIVCPENRLPKNYGRGYYVALYSMVKRILEFLAQNNFIILERVTFEDVPVSSSMLQTLSRVCYLPSLQSITIKRNRAQICLFEAFALKGRFVGTNHEGHEVHDYAYKLPSNSVLETISFEPGVKECDKDDLEALNYFVADNSRINSFPVIRVFRGACYVFFTSKIHAIKKIKRTHLFGDVLTGFRLWCR
jgi:hypothetical protein